MIFAGGFESEQDMYDQWGPSKKGLQGAEILYACYDLYSYEGSAYVFFTRGGKLFEANCSHCSCNGLDYWDPEETDVAAVLKYRIAKDEQPLRDALLVWQAKVST